MVETKNNEIGVVQRYASKITSLYILDLALHDRGQTFCLLSPFFFYYSGYDPSEYDHLQVNNDIKDLFQYITRYTPQNITLEARMRPFIPDYVPAIGDIDAFLKVRS